MSNVLGAAFKPFVEDPYPFYARLRQEEPITFCPELNAWLVTRYKDIQSILTQKEKFSSRNALEVKTFRPRVLEELAKSGIPTPSVLNSDKAEHTRLRMPLAKAFAPARIREREPLIREVAQRLVDAFIHQQRAEMISQFAYPLAVEVAIALFGIPKRDLELAKEWVHNWLTLVTLPLDEEQQLRCVQNVAVFGHYLVDLIAERRKAPQDDLISTLLFYRAPEIEPLTERELVSTLRILTLAGLLSVTSMIGNSLLLLLLRPERWQMLCDHPEDIPHAVEEILRIDSPVRTIARITTQEVTVGGVTLPKDASLQLLPGSGNRDEAVFANADEFQSQRASNPHMAFGHGVHHCVGAALARTEGRVALEVLSQRLPQLHLVPGQVLTHKPILILRGYEQIEVEW